MIDHKKPVEWSKKFTACISCDTVKRKHAANGLCFRCYQQKRAKTIKWPDTMKPMLTGFA